MPRTLLEQRRLRERTYLRIDEPLCSRTGAAFGRRRPWLPSRGRGAGRPLEPAENDGAPRFGALPSPQTIQCGHGELISAPRRSILPGRTFGGCAELLVGFTRPRARQLLR